MKHNSDQQYAWKMGDTVAVAEQYVASLSLEQRADMIQVGGPKTVREIIDDCMTERIGFLPR